MRKFRANIFETTIAILTLLSIVGLGFYFYELLNHNPTQDNPFESFDNNPGIIKISIVSAISRVSFIICFLLLALADTGNNKTLTTIYLALALTIGFLQWFELYYGSTFYYGEVRDKQGLSFPILASLMATLVIWKINYSPTDNRNLTIKLILTGLINVGLYILWTRVYDAWNLWQS